MKTEHSRTWITRGPATEDTRAVYDKLYVLPFDLRQEWRDAVDRLRSAQALLHNARRYPLHYGIVGVSRARQGVLHCIDDLWGVQWRVTTVAAMGQPPRSDRPNTRTKT